MLIAFNVYGKKVFMLMPINEFCRLFFWIFFVDINDGKLLHFHLVNVKYHRSLRQKKLYSRISTYRLQFYWILITVANLSPNHPTIPIRMSPKWWRDNAIHVGWALPKSWWVHRCRRNALNEIYLKRIHFVVLSL